MRVLWQNSKVMTEKAYGGRLKNREVENRQYFSPLYLTPPMTRFSLELGIGAQSQKKTRMMELLDGQKVLR